MRDIVTAKWSLRPQRLVIGVVLIGMLLLTPRQCLGDDEPVTPTDSSQSQPAQQSPTGGPVDAGNSSAATNNHAPNTNAEGRMAAVPHARTGLVDTKNQGSCYSCYGSSCFDKTSTSPLPSGPCSSNFDTKTVACYTYSLVDSPKKVDPKKKPQPQYEKGCWNIRDKECLKGILNVKNTDLYKTGKSGKCVKGKFTYKALACMLACQRQACFEGYGCTGSCDVDKDDSTSTKCPNCLPGSKGCSTKYNSIDPCRYTFDPNDRVDEKTNEYGLFGQDKYAEMTICICIGDKCNTHTENDLKNTVQASSGPMLKSSGLGDLITFTLIVATGSFFRLP